MYSVCVLPKSLVLETLVFFMPYRKRFCYNAPAEPEHEIKEETS